MATKTEDRAAGRRAEPRRPGPQSDESERTRAKAPEGGNTQPDMTTDDRRGRIAEAAYYRAERRGFATGYEDADWLDAEKEMDSRQDDAPGKRGPGQSPAPASERSTRKPGP